MYEIEIINKRTLSSTIDPFLFSIDRFNSKLGNPFVLKNESERFRVVSQYRVWLWKKIENRDKEICQELQKLKDFIIKNKKIKLQCWCAPKLCHGDVIKKCLLYLIENNINFYGDN